MFKKLVKQLLAARTTEEFEKALYGAQGVSRMFENEKISWNEHEMLFELAGRLEEGLTK